MSTRSTGTVFWAFFLAALVFHMVDKVARGVAACRSHEIVCPSERLK